MASVAKWLRYSYGLQLATSKNIDIEMLQIAKLPSVGMCFI